jgi:cysteine synthase
MFNENDSIINFIGKTPMLKLSNYCSSKGLQSEIYAKLEFFNPAGSIKDRIGYSMISDAEKKGLINKDTVIVEPTSGNTGIALAYISTVKKYKLILTMPASMSFERRSLLKGLGATLVLTPEEKGMKGAIAAAEEELKKHKNSFMPNQFKNPANPRIHKLTTGPEIWEATEGNIDYFVAGVGTGGTITGVGEYLKEKNPKIKIVAVEPEESAVISKGKPGPHRIQGIGAGFIPEILNLNIIDEVIKVSGKDAYSKVKEIGTVEGILAGISSGANLHAAEQLAKSNPNKKIVTVFCDTGERYLSTGIYT